MRYDAGRTLLMGGKMIFDYYFLSVARQAKMERNPEETTANGFLDVPPRNDKVHILPMIEVLLPLVRPQSPVKSR
jgi:hypothetical protein